MKERKTRKNKFHLPLHAYLLYLLMATVLFTGVTIARFTTSVSGSSAARVARFEVSADTNAPATAVLDCAGANTSVSYDLTVTSESEVTVKYDVIVKLGKALSTGVTMTLGGKAPSSVSGSTYTFTDVGTIAAGGGEKTHAMVFTASAATLTADYITSVQITVRTEQVD